MTVPPLVAMHDIRKAFGPVEVLHGVDLEVACGEVHALAGENGAGKSTLIKILAGVYDDFSGEMLVLAVKGGASPIRSTQRVPV